MLGKNSREACPPCSANTSVCTDSSRISPNCVTFSRTVSSRNSLSSVNVCTVSCRTSGSSCTPSSRILDTSPPCAICRLRSADTLLTASALLRRGNGLRSCMRARRIPDMIHALPHSCPFPESCESCPTGGMTPPVSAAVSRAAHTVAHPPVTQLHCRTRTDHAIAGAQHDIGRCPDSGSVLPRSKCRAALGRHGRGDECRAQERAGHVSWSFRPSFTIPVCETAVKARRMRSAAF